MKQKVLVVDDEVQARAALTMSLENGGFEVAEAADSDSALEQLKRFNPAAVLADVRVASLGGLELMARARQAGSGAVFVVMAAFGCIDKAVEAVRAGAASYLLKPVDAAGARVALEKALEQRPAPRVGRLCEESADRFRIANFIGEAPELLSIFDVVSRAAPTMATVLLLGESGTGKELIAQGLHDASARKGGPFIKVNCSALAESLLESELFGHEQGSFTGAVGRREGRFELANRGTLLLDEVGELSPALQIKLLRVLQTREFERVGGTRTVKVDVRLVAATNRDLLTEVKAGRFREDLYYRLNVVTVTLPALRARKGDIPALASHFLTRYSEAYGKPMKEFGPGALAALMAHGWPGNVRELENAIERAVVLGKSAELMPADLPPAIFGRQSELVPVGSLIPGASMAAIEREAILRTLEMVGGSTARAAEVLQISARTIQYRLREYGLSSS